MVIAINVLKSHKRDDGRRRTRTKSGWEEPRNWEDAISVDMSDDEGLNEILDAVYKLTPRLRDAFVFRHMDQLKGEALAERLGVKRSSAAAMVSLAKKKLRDLLKHAGGVTK